MSDVARNRASGFGAAVAFSGVAIVAVCGIPGAGKSTVHLRLKALGRESYETDLDGFAAWRDAETKSPVAPPRDWHDPVATRGIEYWVRRDRVEELRRDADGRLVFLCGGAGGEEEFWDLLDLAITLAVDDDTLEHRLRTRTTNDYGRAEHERAAILEANRGWAESYRARGAVVVDATRSIDDVVAEVVAVAEAWYGKSRH